MATTHQSSPCARFGPFEVDFSGSELRRDGKHIPLQDQPFQILRLLLEAAPKVVSREEIAAALWPADTFVDFDLGVNTAVRKLRQALDDSVDHPKFVQTLAKRGYRFIAPVQWTQQASSDSIVPLLPKSPVDSNRAIGNPIDPPHPRLGNRRSTFHWIKAALIPVVAVTICAWLLWMSIARNKAQRQPTLIAMPLTSLPGTAGWPSFSPDGQQLVFAWDPKNLNQAQVYIQPVSGSAQPFQLTHEYPIAIPPVWSPDGQWIAYGRYHHVEGKKDVEIVLIPAPVGGHEVVIETAYEDFGGLSWSPDSHYLAFPDRVTPSDPLGLVLVDRNTLQRQQLTLPPKDTSRNIGDIDPVFSPDGKKIAFVRSPTVGVNQIALLTLASGKVDALQTDYSSDSLCSVLSWDADGQNLVYASDRNGISRLWKIPVTGGTPEPLGVGEDANSVTIARSSHRLAFTRATMNVNIWEADIDGKSVTRAPLIVANRINFQASLSPDGSKIVFTSDRSGFDEIWVVNRDGSDPVQLTFFRKHKTGTPRWSPDGHKIAFDARLNGHAEIYVVGLNGGIPQAITHDSFENMVPSWDADGHEIYYQSMRSGDSQIWKVGTQAGSPLQVTAHGGEWPAISSDGKTLYFIKPDAANELWQKRLPNGEEQPVPALAGIPNSMSFQVVSNGIYFPAPTTAEFTRWTLQFYDFATRKTRTIMPLSTIGFPGISVSKDGRQVFYAQVDNEGSNIMLVENYR